MPRKLGTSCESTRTLLKRNSTRVGLRGHDTAWKNSTCACGRSASGRSVLASAWQLDAIFILPALPNTLLRYLVTRLASRLAADRAPPKSTPANQGEKSPMKLVRFGPLGREKPGIVDDKGRIRDLSKVVSDLAGEALSPKSLAKIRKAPVDKLPLVKGNPRLGACVGKVGNLIA